MADLTTPQHGRLAAAIGDRARLTVELSVTPAGLLAIGGLVTMILLGSAAIVWTARHPV